MQRNHCIMKNFRPSFLGCVASVLAAFCLPFSSQAQPQLLTQYNGFSQAARRMAITSSIQRQRHESPGALVQIANARYPLEMVNPFAPLYLGSGFQNTRFVPNDPNMRPRGIHFVAFEF